MSERLIQIEEVDDVCIACGVRHTPKWLERLMEQDRELKLMLMGRPDPNWFNFHLLTKRAFVAAGAARRP